MGAEHKNITITLMGAGGKMGTRILNNLVKCDYNLLLCEKSSQGIAAIEERGLSISKMEKAIPESDLVIMAVPDVLLGKISEDVVPLMKPDATFLLLDPAAAYAKAIALRDDCTFVVVHPCHPALFMDQETPEAKADVFGGIAARQNIVIALLQGKENNFSTAQDLSKQMFDPVMNAYRITVEHMAILEPAAAEVAGLTAVSILREAVDEAVKRGVPEEAALAFMLGHINIELNVFFRSTNPISDSAKIACKYGIRKMLREDWKNIFTPESIQEVLEEMLHPDSSNP